MSAVGVFFTPLVNLYSKQKDVYELRVKIRFESINGLKVVTFDESYKDYLETIRISYDSCKIQSSS